jgi:hypothetical protein
MTVNEVLRVIVLASSVAGLAVCFAIAIIRPKIWLYTVPPVLLLLNLALFTTARILAGHTLPPEQIPIFNTWSYYIQLHLAFTIAGIGGYILWSKR